MLVIIPFWFVPLSHNSISFTNEGSWYKLCQSGRSLIILASMCLFYVVLVVLFRTEYLIVSWLMTEQGYMWDLLGDVTSIVSSCQLSEGVSSDNLYA